MTLTRRERFLIIFGLVLVSVVVYSFYFLVPFLQDSSDVQARKLAAQTQSATLKVKGVAINKMQDEIAVLKGTLQEKGSTAWTGIDHGEILLYLEKLTKNRAVDVGVNVSGEQALDNRFLTQPVSLDFRTTWPMLQELLEDLKKNELYHRVTMMKIDYAPQRDPSSNPSESSPNDTAKKDANVIGVHLELLFYAFQPEDGAQKQTTLTPASAYRNNSLFPLE